MPASRIYVIKQKGTPNVDGPPPRLVEATHPGNALRHVASDVFSVGVATQADLVQLLGLGTKVEKIAAEQQQLDGSAA